MNLPTFVWLIALPLVASPLIYLTGRLFYLITVVETTALPRSAQLNSGVRTLAWPGVDIVTGGKVNYARWSAEVTPILDLIAFGIAAHDFSVNGTITVASVPVALRFDGLSLLLTVLVLTLSTVVVIFSGSPMAGAAGEEKYYALLLTMIGAMIGLVCASDLFNLWVWFELMVISSYLLVAFYPDQAASLEAGVKYLVQGAGRLGIDLARHSLGLGADRFVSLQPDHRPRRWFG